MYPSYLYIACSIHATDTFQALPRGLLCQTGGDKNFPSLYPSASVTPYLHALVAHLPAHLRYCRSLGVPLKSFGTEAVEKKRKITCTPTFSFTTTKNGRFTRDRTSTKLVKSN